MPKELHPTPPLCINNNNNIIKTSVFANRDIKVSENAKEKTSPEKIIVLAFDIERSGGQGKRIS